MGSRSSKTSKVPPQIQISDAVVKQLFEAQRQEYERKCQKERDSIIAAQDELKKMAETAAALRYKDEIIAQRRKKQEEAFLAAQKKLQEEAAYLEAQKKLQQEMFLNAHRKLQEEADRAFAQRRLEEAAAKRKLEEEAAKRKLKEEAIQRTIEEAAAQRKLEADAAKNKLEEAAANRKLEEEAAKRKLKEEAIQRTIEEAAAQRKLEADAAKNKLEEAAANKKLEEEAAKRKLKEEAFQRKLEEEAFKRKLEEEAFKRKREEKKIKLEEEIALKRKYLEEVFQRKLKDDAAQRKLQEEAFQRTLEEAAAKKVQEEPATRTRNKPITACVSRSRYCKTCNKLSTTMFKCDEGHASCSSCRRSWRNCSSTISDRKSFDTNNDHSRQTKVPCPNTDDGCKPFIKIADIAHMKESPFKQHHCPLGAVFRNCKWQGELNRLSSHFDEKHPRCLDTEVGSELYIKNIQRNRRYVRLIENGCHFVFHLKISEIDSKVYMVVQLIGSRHSAMQYLYKIHVYNKSESHRKYMYTDNCCSTIDNIDNVFKKEECAVLPMWYANTFVANGALTLKYFIKRIDEKTDFGRYRRSTSIFDLEDD